MIIEYNNRDGETYYADTKELNDNILEFVDQDDSGDYSITTNETETTFEIQYWDLKQDEELSTSVIIKSDITPEEIKQLRIVLELEYV